jgi:transposase-like protein
MGIKKKTAAKAAGKKGSNRGIYSDREKKTIAESIIVGHHTAKEMATAWGVSENTIYSWVKKYREEQAAEREDKVDPASKGNRNIEVAEHNQEILKEYAGTFEILAEEEAVYKVLITKLVGNTVTPVFVSQGMTEPPVLHHDFNDGYARITWDLEK